MGIVPDYLKNQADNLNSLYRGSSLPKHAPDTGSNREQILIEWLDRHLPKIVTARNGGNIIDSSGTESNQVDVIVYENSSPRLEGRGKTHYFAEGVAAAIEIKSQLDSKELIDALKKLESVKNCRKVFSGNIFIGDSNPKITTGIFAFESKFTSPQSLIAALEKHKKNGITPVNFVCINKVTYIIHNDGHLLALTDEKKKLSNLPKGYIATQIGDISLGGMYVTLSKEARKVVLGLTDYSAYLTPD